MTKRVIDIPNWRLKLYETPGLMESLFAGLDPGMHVLKIEHEPLCAELHGGVCNCDAKFKVERCDAGS